MISSASDNSAEIVVCGAGMAGLAAAYQLSVKFGQRGVVIVDSREPLTMTSDKGTQGYRNWWPGPDDTMFRMVSHSIDLMEEMALENRNLHRMGRRGYLFVTATDEGIEQLRSTAQGVAKFGMGEVREHRPGASNYRPAPAEGFIDQPTGADLLFDGEATKAFPYLSEKTRAALHVRRAGWMNSVALGAWMLRKSLAAGATFVRDRVTGIETNGGRVSGVKLGSGRTIQTGRVVFGAGPELPEIASMLGVDLPVFLELHAKITFPDDRGVVPRGSPFSIWIDPMHIPWSAEEKARFAGSASTKRLLEKFPGGVHARPIDGPRGNELWIIWTYHTEPTQLEEKWSYDPEYGEICLRGLQEMIPGIAQYAGTSSRGVVDGGYYCKTPENRPLVGPLGPEGAYLIGALGGSGIMQCHALGELVAQHITGATLPDYARWFLPSRYESADYRKLAEEWGSNVGQL